MFLIIPLLLISGLLSVIALCVWSAIYGVGLIVLARTICNVRQETSRNSLRSFIYYLGLDHLFAAGASLISIVLMSSNPGWLAGPVMRDQSGDVVIGTILAFFMVLYVFVGILLLVIGPDLRASAPLSNQLRWNGWTVAMIVIGVLLNLVCFAFFLVMAAPMLWLLSRMDRASRQSSLIWTLAIAIKRGLPLGPEVDALSTGLWGRHRLRLQLLAENLNAGLPLSAALERQPGLVPFSGVMLIRVGEETGCLAQAAETLAVGYARQHDRRSELISAANSMLMLMAPLIVIPQIVGFVCVYIIPKFKKIFADFGTELPEVTVNFIFVSDMVVKYFYLFIPLFLGGVVAVVIYLAVGDSERDWPLLKFFAPRTNGPPILRTLALLIRERRPLGPGIQAMVWSHPSQVAKRRLEVIYQDMQQGKPFADSLSEQRMIRRGDASLLKSAERVRNIPWVLDQIAELMEDQFWYRLRVLMEVGYPVGIVLIGTMILFISLAFFMPLVKLLNDLS